MTATASNPDHPAPRCEPAGRTRRAALATAFLLGLAAQSTPAAAPQATAAAGTPTVLPDNALPARFALRFDPEVRCPELRKADPEDEAIVVVVFKVGPTGVPSQPAVRTSSGSPALDTAAIDCVSKLRFLPATSLGDGNPVSSWQQAAWRWSKAGRALQTTPTTQPAQPAQTIATAGAAPVAPAFPASGTASIAAPGTGVAASGTGAAAIAGSQAREARAGGGAAEVRVCVDAAGKLAQDPELVQSSGDPDFDAAALQIARSGSGHYRPAKGPGGHPAPGCEQLSVRME
jgi:TonB family protein